MPAGPNIKQIVGLIGWLLVTFTAMAIGAAASVQARQFYGELAQPAWAPPGWVFGPVWTILYALMGVAAWLVWRSGGWGANRAALGLFVAQLALNAVWSWLFFAWRQGGWAFVDLLALLAAALICLVNFWRVRPLAGGLLVPYLLWLGFACLLNLAVWQMNREQLGNSRTSPSDSDYAASLTAERPVSTESR